MKFRNGFVTNSSSSSFICEVCGYMDSGYDADLSDFGMVECVNGHTFCISHINNNIKRETKIKYLKKKNPALVTLPFNKLDEEKINELLKQSGVKDLDEELEDGYEISWLYCPICTMDYISDRSKLMFLLKEHTLSEAIIQKEIQSKFDSLEDLNKFLKNS